MEKNKDKEIENLKFKLSEKEEQNKMLEAQLKRHLTNEQRIVSENKILKCDCKELEMKQCSSQSEHRLMSDQFRKLDVIVGKVDTILLRTKPSYASLLSADTNSPKTPNQRSHNLDKNTLSPRAECDLPTVNGSSTCLRTVETSEQQTCKTTSPAPSGNEQNEPPDTTNNRTLYRNTCDTNSDDTCIQFGIVKASTHDTVGQHIPSLVSGTSMFSGVRKKKVARFVLSRISADKPFTIVSDAIVKYASQRNIVVTFVRLMKTWTNRDGKNTIYTVQVNIHANCASKIVDSFWPDVDHTFLERK